MTINEPRAQHTAATTYGADYFGSPLALPAFVVTAVNVILVVSALAAAGYMRPMWTAVFIVGALVIATASIAVIVAERRRARRVAEGRALDREDVPLA